MLSCSPWEKQQRFLTLGIFTKVVSVSHTQPVSVNRHQKARGLTGQLLSPSRGHQQASRVPVLSRGRVQNGAPPTPLPAQTAMRSQQVVPMTKRMWTLYFRKGLKQLSQHQHHWHLGSDNSLLWGPSWALWEVLAASLASTHWRTSSLSCNKQRYLQAVPNGPQGAK